VQPRIGLVTCVELPEPDPDREVLRDALQTRGASAEWIAWDDPTARWDDLDLAVVRSTWNYYLRPWAFLDWAAYVSSQTRLLNPLEVLRFNIDKTYLGALEREGVRVVPTEYVRQGTAASLESVLRRRGWDDVVLKPSISAGSYETYRASSSDLSHGDACLSRMLASHTVMVQPYMRSVEAYGERSMVMIAGEITHAIRKSPRFSGGEERVEVVEIAPEERIAAREVLHRVKGELLYARIDLVRDDEGQPALAELELMEPSLFLLQKRGALDRLVDAMILKASRRDRP
jgi:hypothetical protein